MEDTRSCVGDRGCERTEILCGCGTRVVMTICVCVCVCDTLGIKSGLCNRHHDYHCV